MSVFDYLATPYIEPARKVSAPRDPNDPKTANSLGGVITALQVLLVLFGVLTIIGGIIVATEISDGGFAVFVLSVNSALFEFALAVILSVCRKYLAKKS